mmetsp:Transcript_47104/g.143118  ORF Transcript_47104/g.143118 Transcript_47104/m.143118 type:complete len:226 (-) Transcript_47104:178-855(-)
MCGNAGARVSKAPPGASSSTSPLPRCPGASGSRWLLRTSGSRRRRRRLKRPCGWLRLPRSTWTACPPRTWRGAARRARFASRASPGPSMRCAPRAGIASTRPARGRGSPCPRPARAAGSTWPRTPTLDGRPRRPCAPVRCVPVAACSAMGEGVWRGLSIKRRVRVQAGKPFPGAHGYASGMERARTRGVVVLGLAGPSDACGESALPCRDLVEFKCCSCYELTDA